MLNFTKKQKLVKIEKMEFLSLLFYNKYSPILSMLKGYPLYVKTSLLQKVLKIFKFAFLLNFSPPKNSSLSYPC